MDFKGKIFFDGSGRNDHTIANVFNSSCSAFKSGIEIGGIPIIPALDINGTFVATWFAHTGFGLPLATFPEIL